MNKRQSKKNSANHLKYCLILELRQQLRIFPYNRMGLKQSEAERVLKFFK